MANRKHETGGLQNIFEAYGSSESDDGDDEEVENRPQDEPPAKNPKLSFTSEQNIEKLPIPTGIQKMFNDSNQPIDDPLQHGGRKRTFEHVRGNWASFVYLPFSDENETMQTALKVIKRSIGLCEDNSAKRPATINLNTEFHLSLTKTVVLHHHWIESFTSALRKSFKTLKRFNLLFTEFDVYLNEEKDRTFIGINIFPSATLLNIVRYCDNCLKEYNLETFYKDHSFHVSLAWCVGNNADWIRSHLLPIINNGWVKEVELSDSELQNYTVKMMELKTGNNIHKFRLET